MENGFRLNEASFRDGVVGAPANKFPARFR